MALDDIPVACTLIAPGKYQASTVPIPHSAFESYVLQVSPSLGLSWIKAIGRDLQTGPHGMELVGEFDSMENRLTSVYGPGDRTDFLMPDSIWNEPGDRMMGFVNHERYLMTQWSAEVGSRMKDSLVSIGLIASALSANSGYLSVEYSFENAAAADAELVAMEDQAL